MNTNELWMSYRNRKALQISAIFFWGYIWMAASVEAEILKFKMTNKELPLPSGFTRICADTQYSKELAAIQTLGEGFWVGTRRPQERFGRTVRIKAADGLVWSE